MHEKQLQRWRHSHAFGQDLRRPGETKTLIVIAITGTMMVVEIVAGVVYGSMALLADGLHMASHAAALSINAFAYVYARRHAHDPRFSFGTGKVNVLGGFTGAVLLAGFALAMAMESIGRLIAPVPIAFNQAILVAVLGLIVNGASVLILEQKKSGDTGEEGGHRAGGDGGHRRHSADHSHENTQGHGDNRSRAPHHGHTSHRGDASGHGDRHTEQGGDASSHGDRHAEQGGHGHVHHHGLGHHHGHGHHHHHAQDHNLVSAYLHVLADALTSLLAIFALLSAKYFGYVWMDPAMGIVGAILVARWSIGLLRSTSTILLDGAAPKEVSDAVRGVIEAADDNRIADLHVWAVGPGIYSAIISVVTHEPRSPDYYKNLIPADIGIVHVSVEVNRCAG